MKGFGCVVPGKKAGWITKVMPTAGPYDAVMRPLIVAPCSSDVHNAFRIGPQAFLRGRILGHEAVAEVVSVGTCVKDFKPGDKVVVPAVTPDWREPSIEDTCHQHNKTINDAFKYAFSLDGAFAEYFLLPDIDMNGAHLPAGMPLEQAVMVCDMVPTGFHGVELAKIGFGETVLVIGAGPGGLMAIAGTALRGAGRIIVVENRMDRIAIAWEYGATDVIDYEAGDIVSQAKALTGKNGIDKVIIAGGGAESFEAAVKIVRPGGRVANINFYTGMEHLPLPVLAWGSGMAHKTIVGGLCPGGRRRMEKMLAVVSRGYFDPSRLITHKFHGLDNIEPAFYLMADKPAGLIKPVVYLD